MSILLDKKRLCICIVYLKRSLDRVPMNVCVIQNNCILQVLVRVQLSLY